MTITNWMRVVRTETGSALPIVASFCGNAALVGIQGVFMTLGVVDRDQQTLNGSFSAAPKPIFAGKY